MEPKPEWITGPEGKVRPIRRKGVGYAGMKRLLEAADEPTAVLCRNDFTATGSIAAARDLRREVPGDVSIIGFDNIPLSSYVSPALTTVEQPAAEQGRLAGQMLMERLTRQWDGARREQVLPCRLIVRKSCGVKS